MGQKKKFQVNHAQGCLEPEIDQFQGFYSNIKLNQTLKTFKKLTSFQGFYSI